MPRSLMNAVLVFGEVAIPVKLHSATSSGGIHFHEVHLKDGARIEHRRFCVEEDREVPYEEVVKGHEIRDGEFAVLTKEQLAAATPEGDKTIRVEAFVPAGDIDPVLFERAYHLGAGDGAGGSYRLLHDRERLAAVRAQDGILVLQTLRAADAVVDLEDLRPDDEGRKPSPKERRMAEQLIDSLHEPFKAADHRDEHRDLVLKLIEAKAAGEEIELPDVEEPEAPEDLAAALQASLDERGHSGRRRRATARKKAAPAKQRRGASSKKKGG
jgi:DNA end-binding protein Ku